MKHWFVQEEENVWRAYLTADNKRYGERIALVGPFDSHHKAMDWTRTVDGIDTAEKAVREFAELRKEGGAN